jgi:hypothetical protein
MLSPVGTTEETLAAIQSSRRDLIMFTVLFPSNELLGYCHVVPSGTDYVIAEPVLVKVMVVARA